MKVAHGRVSTVRYSPLVGKKLSLPIVDDIARRAGATPTIERARQKLGGPGATDARAGRTVRDAAGALGIVLHANGDELDVIVGSAGVVRRTKAAAWTEAEAVDLGDLAEVVRDVIAFARLAVGDRVSFVVDGRLDVGLLFEKCRYGALVARDDERIVAVGYRALQRALDP